MTPDTTFWRNLTVICLFHLGILFGIAQWSASTRKPLGSGIVWMERGAETGNPVAPPQLVVEEAAASPIADEESKAEKEPAEEMVMKEPAAVPRATPKKAKPAAMPKTTTTPASKKIPKPSTKVTAKQKEHTRQSDGAAKTGSNASSAGDASQFNSYGKMLHDRFFSSWEQPTSVVATGARMSVLVRLRIEKDGRVSDFALVRPSGNVVVDQSVAEVAKRVTQVDPLPAGLASGGHYDVNLNFELNAN